MAKKKGVRGRGGAGTSGGRAPAESVASSPAASVQASSTREPSADTNASVSPLVQDGRRKAARINQHTDGADGASGHGQESTHAGRTSGSSNTADKSPYSSSDDFAQLSKSRPPAQDVHRAILPSIEESEDCSFQDGAKKTTRARSQNKPSTKPAAASRKPAPAREPPPA